MTDPQDASRPPGPDDAARTGLGLPAEPDGTPRRAVTGFLALARFLLAETPERAEEFSADVPELRRIVEQDRGVIRYPEPSGPMYVSVRDGLRTTSPEPPAWADPAEIIDVPERPPPGRALLGRLRAAADEVRRLDQDRHAVYRVAGVVRAVEQRYGDVLTADTAGCLEAIGAEPVLDTRSGERDGLAGFRRLTDHVLAGYRELTLSGAAVQRMIALTMLMEVAGDLAGDALAAARAEMSRLYADGGGEPGGTLFVSPLDFGLWTGAFDQTTGGRAWIPALSAARLCQQQADQYRDAARRELTAEQFHRFLYQGLGYYLAAALLLGVVTGAGPGRVREPLLSEAADRAASCEEMRARIETSVGWAAEVNPLGCNLTYPARLEAWVLSLPATTAPIRIYDVSSQLGYPDVIRDVALAVADLAAGRDAQCAQRAAAAARAMAAPAALPLTVEWGLGYLSYAAALAQRVLEKLGRAAEAADLARYNDSAWLAAQVASPAS
jgi:hypothetical protein